MSETGSLAGVRVVVTRATHQAGPLVEALRGHGAIVVKAPAISIVDPADGGAGLRAAIDRVLSGYYRWVVVTSANGADRLVGALADRAWPKGVDLASVGPSTTESLEAAGLPVTLVAHEAIGESLVSAFPQAPRGETARAGANALVVRAEAGRPTVPAGLAALGWQVDMAVAYRTVATTFDDEARAAVAQSDIITFASGRTARFVVDACGVDALPRSVVCIGPVAADAATSLGLQVVAVANPHTAEGLVAAVIIAAGS